MCVDIVVIWYDDDAVSRFMISVKARCVDNSGARLSSLKVNNALVVFVLDDEYFFADPESKLSKYSPKGWKSSSTYVSVECSFFSHMLKTSLSVPMCRVSYGFCLFYFTRARVHKKAPHACSSRSCRDYVLCVEFETADRRAASGDGETIFTSWKIGIKMQNRHKQFLISFCTTSFFFERDSRRTPLSQKRNNYLRSEKLVIEIRYWLVVPRALHGLRSSRF